MSRRLLLGTGGGAGEFDPFVRPELLTGCEADMTGSDLTLNVDKVINWGRSSLTQVTQGSDPKRFVRQVAAGDGLLELVCEGVDDEMTVASNLVLNPSSFSIFSVIRFSTGNSDFYSTLVAGGNEILFTSRGTLDLTVRYGGVKSQYGDAGASPWDDDTYRIFEHQMDGTNAGHFLNVDDVLFSWPVNPSTSDPGTASVSLSMTIGSGLGFFFMTGAWRAWFVFAPQLPPAVSAQMVTYLNNKWVVF